MSVGVGAAEAMNVGAGVNVGEHVAVGSVVSVKVCPIVGTRATAEGVGSGTPQVVKVTACKRTTNRRQKCWNRFGMDSPGSRVSLIVP